MIYKSFFTNTATPDPPPHPPLILDPLWCFSHTRVHTHAHEAHARTRVHRHTHTHRHTNTRAHTDTQAHARTQEHTGEGTQAHARTQADARTQAHAQAHTQAHARTHFISLLMITGLMIKSPVQEVRYLTSLTDYVCVRVFTSRRYILPTIVSNNYHLTSHN